MTYDYMLTYFEFFKIENRNSTAQFQKLREVVEKYQDCPIQHFKTLFSKIKEYIDEIESKKAVEEDQSDSKKGKIDSSLANNQAEAQQE